MKKIIIGAVLILTILLSSCGTSSTPLIDNPTKPVSTMTEKELIQMVDRYAEKAQSDRQVFRATAYGTQAIFYQNELILRELRELNGNK